MKQALITILTLLFFIPAAAAVEPERGEFQWGASARAIKSFESGPPKREVSAGPITYLIFPGEFGGEKVTLIDRLIDDKLFEVSFVFESNGRNCAELGKKFQEVITELTAKHGAANGAGADPCNASREWDLGNTTLVVSMSTKSGRSDLSAVYQSKELGKLADTTTVQTTKK